MQQVLEGISLTNDFLWSKLLIVLLIGCGFYFTIRSRFVQLGMFKEMFVVLKESNVKSKDSISSLQAFCISMAVRVGTGNITGIAIAIALGGPGAVFDVGYCDYWFSIQLY